MIGITQVLAWRHDGSLKDFVDKEVQQPNLRTTMIGGGEDASDSKRGGFGYYSPPSLSDEQRDEQVRRAIIDLLGKEKVKVKVEVKG